MNSTTPGDRISLVTLMLASEFGIVPTSVAPGPSGTATRNYVATTEAGTDWFVKTYPAGTARKEAESAAALSEYARRCRVPVAAARYTVGRQRLVASRGEVTMSVTRYLRDTVTADGRVAGGRWEAVGEAIGRLHRGLARHRFGPPRLDARDRAVDPVRSRSRLEGLVHRYETDPPRTHFERWALETARERLARLPAVERLLEGAPERTISQLVHGDLSGPNVLLRGDEVAAVIDFAAPRRRSPLWELGRLALDPRTVLAQPDWPEGLGRLAAAYRRCHPAVPVAELMSLVRLTAVYLGCTVYPLNAVVDGLGPVTESLETYARDRADAAAVLRERLDEAEEVLRHHLR
ncbi:phosphotransferase enzyme family protein [Streptomyces sp. NPDC018711]|uniref:phosphotransferase enzyme family protein n=1 Tax=Streptomyces sp. NPDC018711 TaxID=3365052 RepID=UPI0037AD1296